MHKLLLTTLALTFGLGSIIAQEKLTAFGLQFKPIFGNEALRTGPVTVEEGEVQATFQTKSGYSFGGIIRHGLTKVINIETGINMVVRNIDFNVQSQSISNPFNESAGLSITSYEVPLNLLVYVKFSENFYLNAAGGLSCDMYPSDYRYDNADNFFHDTYYQNKFNLALNANIGAEYRTEKSGFFYLGISWHQPFKDAIYHRITNQTDGSKEQFEVIVPQRGSFITADLRYFFPGEKKEKNRAR